MLSYPILSPTGLPSSPQANCQMQMLSPLDTSFSSDQSPPLYSASSSPGKHIFANATIPLSPKFLTSSLPSKDNPYKGLKPRKHSGLAHLFCCFGREERAQQRVERSLEFE
ncbi:hypothetical protein EJ02DRAFT_362198 [Clathrospora elynae]|uniref:Uncharacterized protein n=1 Tax=Clathrospora elynae TaxID=706981 RepID=A0A6A5S9Q6_9PLEO|nr:hypothetical protein EJ02DRAFT_362198 [Clathrospora elynae]